MWWWQSQALGGAFSLGGAMPDEFGTSWAWLCCMETPVAAASVAAEATLMKVRRATIFDLPDGLHCYLESFLLAPNSVKNRSHTSARFPNCPIPCPDSQ